MSGTSVDLSAIAAFVRQHTHDMRNYLSGFDLEAALLAEIVTDSEAVECVKRLRSQIRTVASDLKALSSKFARNQGHPACIPAREIFFLWQDQAADLGLDSIAWGAVPDDVRINVDVAAIGGVLNELLNNAMQFTGSKGLSVTSGLREGRLEFELREFKPEVIDPSSWGVQPFVSTKRGGYGLGLWQAAETVEANGGKITRACLPNKTLVTRLSFPLA